MIKYIVGDTLLKVMKDANKEGIGKGEWIQLISFSGQYMLIYEGDDE